jgi:hypothetical protein
MQPEVEEVLRNDLNRGHQAELAYNSFIEPFIVAKRQQLFDIFQDSSIVSQDDLVEIKRMLLTLNSLDEEIKGVIQSGRMAEIQLGKKETH